MVDCRRVTIEFLYPLRKPAADLHELLLHHDEGKAEGPISVGEANHRFAKQRFQKRTRDDTQPAGHHFTRHEIEGAVEI